VDETGRPPDHFRFSRSDLALMRRAARANWGVPDVLRTEALYQAAEILADDEADTREKIAAMRLLAVFDVADINAARLELARLKLAKPEATDARDALLDEAEGMI
jgi:hypothetical protein